MKHKRQKCYFHLFYQSIKLRQLLPTEVAFFQNYMTNIVKNDEIRQDLSTSHFSDIITKIRTFLFVTFCQNINLAPRIRNSVKGNIKYKHIYLLFLKKLSPKILNKGIFLRRSCKISRRDKYQM